MTACWPDEGFVVMRHDGKGWVIIHQNGQHLAHNVDIGPEDPPAARRWLRELVIAQTDTTPLGLGEDADMYALDRREGQLVGTPVGGFRHDERGWVLTDSLGHTTHVNDDISEEDYDAAVDWAHAISSSKPGYRPSPSETPVSGARYFNADSS